MSLVLAKPDGAVFHLVRTGVYGPSWCREGWTDDYRTFGEADAVRRGFRLCGNCVKSQQKHERESASSRPS